MTNNKTVLSWIDEMKALVNPDQVVWIDGSEEQLEALRKEACETGELIKLNQEKLPGCYYHRTAVLRIEPSSAPETKRMQARPTTGRTPRKLIRCSTTSHAAATRAVRCT